MFNYTRCLSNPEKHCVVPPFHQNFTEPTFIEGYTCSACIDSLLPAFFKDSPFIWYSNNNMLLSMQLVKDLSTISMSFSMGPLNVYLLVKSENILLTRVATGIKKLNSRTF